MLKKVHFLGIGGSGASAAAALAEAQGFEVTGCDLQPHNEFTEKFSKDQLITGHSAFHLRGGGTNIDILAVTPAIFSLDPDNPELITAKEKGIEVLTWQQFLGQYIAKDKFVIAVCGTHGKSTTTAMIAKLLEDASFDPTVELGAIVPKWETNYRIGQSKYLVIEADEFNDNFLSFTSDITIVTNIEMDHPEYFADFEAVKDSFRQFLNQTKQIIVANISDSGVAAVLKVVMKESFVKALDYSKNELGIELQIPGTFNKLNALAAMQVGVILGIDANTIKNSLSSYTGISRRFEHVGNYHGAQIYSDFGHHPTEIKKTMEAAREKFPDQKLWLVYQPHMFSRTKALFDDFVQVFQNLPVDGATILDIYPSREVDTGLVSSQELVEAIDSKTVEYTTWEKFKSEYISYFSDQDVIFFMGAGDSDKWAKELVSK